MCIYLGDEFNLTYNNREHIFPKGLGGIKTLPKEYVSDQANNLFSSWEKALLRDSLISVNRRLYGPKGRRKHKSCKIDIGVEQVSREPRLHYILEGRPYNILQCLLRKKGEFQIVFPEDFKNKSPFEKKHHLEKFRNILNDFRFISSDGIDKTEFIVGLHDNQYFVAAKEKNDIDIAYFKKALDIILNDYNEDNIRMDTVEIESKIRMTESREVIKAYKKIAINALASLKGYEFVKMKVFDSFISEIVCEKNSEFKMQDIPNFIKEKTFFNIFPDKAHSCIFMVIEDNFCMMVCFYGAIYRMFSIPYFSHYISNDVNIGRDPFGLICDWKNNRELTLDEWIYEYTGHSNNNHKYRGEVVMADFKYEIKEEIGILSESGKGWTKELNLISYNGAEAKYDIRDWAPEREKMGKGVTLTEDEARELYNKLKDIFG